MKATSGSSIGPYLPTDEGRRHLASLRLWSDCPVVGGPTRASIPLSTIQARDPSGVWVSVSGDCWEAGVFLKLMPGGVADEHRFGDTTMNHKLDRRQFIQVSAAAAGAALLSPLARAAAPARTATDIVPLGKTGLMISRLGLGAGSNSGQVQRNLGQEEFNRLIRYAYDRGITYIDCAQSYRTFEWIADATKGLPREKLFLQSKIGGKPEDVLAAIDHHRKVYNTDYIDSMLIHCMVKCGWTDELKRNMDAYNEAKSRKWIRSKGVSCHSLPALQGAVESDWTEVHLVRIDPQGHVMDTPAETVFATSDSSHVDPVMAEIKKMHAKDTA